VRERKKERKKKREREIFLFSWFKKLLRHVALSSSVSLLYLTPFATVSNFFPLSYFMTDGFA
jgi:hypothetical protein